MRTEEKNAFVVTLERSICTNFSINKRGASVCETGHAAADAVFSAVNVMQCRGPPTVR